MIKIEKILNNAEDTIPEDITVAIEKHAFKLMESFESLPALSFDELTIEAEIKITGYYQEEFTGE